jgi:hypothetical protein
MVGKNSSNVKCADITPAALLLAERVSTIQVDGHFDVTSRTWSNRSFACASAKKHNEAM